MRDLFLVIPAALSRQAKLMPRFLLTLDAATHCPRFLKPVHDWCDDSPVREGILSESSFALARDLTRRLVLLPHDLAQQK